MVDVAHLAQVSPQTVSRVLNGYEFIRPATRDRVLNAIERLGYRPNLAARALVTSRTRTIGVVATDYLSYGPANALWGVEQAARDAGYAVNIVGLRETSYTSLSQSLERLAQQVRHAPVLRTEPALPAVRAVFARQHGLAVRADRFVHGSRRLFNTLPYGIVPSPAFCTPR